MYFSITYGVPLDIVLNILKDNDMDVDWINVYENSKKENWNIRTLITKLDHAISDVYGPEYKNLVIKRLKLYIENNGK